MGLRLKEYENNDQFLEFLNTEFDHTAAHATVEELAKFAFGSLRAAIEAYQLKKKD